MSNTGAGSARDERAELERALSALAPDSPARGPILEALKALNTREGLRGWSSGGTAPSNTGTPTSGRGSAPTGPPGISSTQKTIAAIVVVILAIGGIFVTQTTVVPTVVDEESSFAAGALRSAGFEISVTTRPDGDVREGHVLSQSPEGGSRVRRGSEVSLVVSELPTFTLNGTFTLLASTDGPSTNCVGRGGYDDIRSGISVTVRDGASRILATGSLGNGQRSSGGGSCTYSFRVADIKQSDFYSVEVGRRGSLSYSHAEMRANGWQVAFSLG